MLVKQTRNNNNNNNNGMNKTLCEGEKKIRETTYGRRGCKEWYVYKIIYLAKRYKWQENKIPPNSIYQVVKTSYKRH